MKRILITGCSGFLASFLIDRLNADTTEKYEVYGFTEIPGFKSSKIKVTTVDIRDRDAVLAMVKQVRPDITFHLAAISNVGFSWKHPKLTYDINFIGSSNLMEALAEFSPGGRLLLMSSAELYGGVQDPDPDFLMAETLPIKARNPYALSKFAMEMAADLYLESRDMHIVKLRSFNFTGPRQDRKFVAADFSHQIAEIEKGKREPVIHVGNLSAIRDLSDVRDITRYLTTLAGEGEAGGIYNLCSGSAYSIRQVLDILLSLSKAKIEVRVDKNKLRPVDVPRLAGDNSRLFQKFNLRPEFDIRRTLGDLLNYQRGQWEGEPVRVGG